MKKLNIILVLVAVFMFSSCMSVRYIVDVSDDASFSQYDTYRVEEHCLEVEIGVNPINKQRIFNAIEINLRNQGMRSSENPDILVKFFVTNEVKSYVEGCDETYESWEGGAYCIERIHTYKEGTLVLDIIDEKAQKVVWHGSAEGPVLNTDKNPQQTIRKLVTNLLNDFNRLRKQFTIT